MHGQLKRLLRIILRVHRSSELRLLNRLNLAAVLRLISTRLMKSLTNLVADAVDHRMLCRCLAELPSGRLS